MEIITIIIALAIAFIALKFLAGLLRMGAMIAVIVVAAILLTRGGFA